MVKIFRLTLLIGLFLSFNTVSGKSSETYAGLEFLGSTKCSREKLETLINLKPEANSTHVKEAAARLKKYFEHNHLNANILVVSAEQGQLALVVDLPDSLTSVETRRLNSPHCVRLTSEKPLLLLADLHNRLSERQLQGRPAEEIWRDGFKFYSDEPANQIIQAIEKFLPTMRLELVEMANSDPDPLRRSEAIELLEWGPEPKDTLLNLLEALDDIDLRVRSECAQYFYARLNLLTDDFPYASLIESLARMLDRPTHQDRNKALHILLRLCQLHQDLVPLAKRLSKRTIERLSQESILPIIKQPANQLLTLFAASPNYASPLNSKSQPQAEGF